MTIKTPRRRNLDSRIHPVAAERDLLVINNVQCRVCGAKHGDRCVDRDRRPSAVNLPSAASSCLGRYNDAQEMGLVPPLPGQICRCCGGTGAGVDLAAGSYEPCAGCGGKKRG